MAFCLSIAARMRPTHALGDLLNTHSQMCTTIHPCRLSFWRVNLSRRFVAANFFSQNSMFFFGVKFLPH